MWRLHNGAPPDDGTSGRGGGRVVAEDFDDDDDEDEDEDEGEDEDEENVPCIM